MMLKTVLLNICVETMTFWWIESSEEQYLFWFFLKLKKKTFTLFFIVTFD